MLLIQQESIQRWLTDDAANILLAHRPEQGSDRAAETLVEHSDLVMHYAEMLIQGNGVGSAVDRALLALTLDGEALDEPVRDMIWDYFMHAIYVHDIGKVNPVFQRHKMKNKSIRQGAALGDSNHSMLSAVLYLHIHLPKLREWEDTVEQSKASRKQKQKQREIIGLVRHVLYTFAYTISRHHTYLGHMDDAVGDYCDFEIKIRNQVQMVVDHPEYLYYYRDQESFLQDPSLFQDIEKARHMRGTDMHPPFPLYILVKLLYSTMVASDFRATYEYMEQKPLTLQYFGEQLPLSPMLDAYRHTEIVKGIRTYQHTREASTLSDMNRLRAELFIETENRLLERLDETIFFLEGPTGSGKTNMSINLALQLLDRGLGLNKLVYVFPFNSLIEQTKQTLTSIFSKEGQTDYRIEVINSITPMVTKEETKPQGAGRSDHEPDNTDFTRVLLERQLLQYPVTLTSHVNLFSYLFGTGRESNLAFAHLCNSVIVLDEIQSYRQGLWKEIIHFLRSFADLLNCKIIIMSATLPQLDQLMEQQEGPGQIETYSLVENRELYFTNPLFRNRVQPHFEWLQAGRLQPKQLLDNLLAIMEGRTQKGSGNRILIEFIKKKSARNFYKLLQKHVHNMPIYELTEDDSHFTRQQVLQQLGKDGKGQFLFTSVIVVATQVIEAGVDIDMDVGFKDISLLDSEEQFLGRLNRSCLREDCHAYFFDLDQASEVYKQDWRTEYDLHYEPYQQMLIDKDFSGFYQLSMRRINESRSKLDEHHWFHFEDKVQKLNYPGVQNHMNLIPDQTVSLFLNYTHPLEDGSVLSGEEVWELYLSLVRERNIDYSERMVRLSAVRKEMNYFTYTYRIERQGETPGIYTQQIGTLYYVSGGEEYMEWDELTNTKKFNRAKYTDAEKGIWL